MDISFEYLEHKSDILVKVYGDSLEKAFEHAAMAFFQVLIRNPKEISNDTKKHFIVKGENLEELLYRFLEEFIFIFDTEKLIFSYFQIMITYSKKGYEANVSIMGEKFQPIKHKAGIEVKGITYHMMKVDRKEGKIEIIFLLDI